MLKFQEEIDAEKYAEFDKAQGTNIIEEWEETCANCGNIKDKFELCSYCEDIC